MVIYLFLILTFHSYGLLHAATVKHSPHPREEKQWFPPTGTVSLYCAYLVQLTSLYEHITEKSGNYGCVCLLYGVRTFCMCVVLGSLKKVKSSGANK